MEIVGIVTVVLGLLLGTYGAYLIFQADFPRNDWIVECLEQISEKLRYGLIAPDNWDPETEKQTALIRAREVAAQAKRYAQQSRRGMGAILFGFLFQFAGNGMLLWPHIKKCCV